MYICLCFVSVKCVLVCVLFVCLLCVCMCVASTENVYVRGKCVCVCTRARVGMNKYVRVLLHLLALV